MNTDAADRREEGFAQIVSEVHGHVDFTPREQMVRALCSSVPVELLTYWDDPDLVESEYNLVLGGSPVFQVLTQRRAPRSARPRSGPDQATEHLL